MRAFKLSCVFLCLAYFVADCNLIERKIYLPLER